MSDLFGAPPPPSSPGRRDRRPPAAAAPADPEPAAQAPHCAPAAIMPTYGPVTLYDGRQVDSGSIEWARECLARMLMRRPRADRDEFMAPMKQAAQVELRMLIQSIEATERGRR